MNVTTPHALLPPLLSLVSATGQTRRIAEEMILESYEVPPPLPPLSGDPLPDRQSHDKGPQFAQRGTSQRQRTR